MSWPAATWATKRALAAGAQLREPRWRLRDALLAFVAAQLIVPVVGYLAMAQGIDVAHGFPRLGLVVIPWVFLAGVPFWVSRRTGNGPRLDFGFLARPEHLRLGAVAGILAIVVGVVAGSLWTKFVGPITSAVANLVAGESVLVVVVLALLAAIGAPLVEEIFFRGLLYCALAQAGLTERWTVVASAALFSLAHFEPSRILILFFSGLVFAEVRRRTGGCAASVVAHAVNNALPAIGMIFIAISGQ